METQFMIKVFGKTFVFQTDFFMPKDADSSGNDDLIVDDRSEVDHSNQDLNEDPELMVPGEPELQKGVSDREETEEEYEDRKKNRKFKVGFVPNQKV
jgi:hypothetical protein